MVSQHSARQCLAEGPTDHPQSRRGPVVSGRQLPASIVNPRQQLLLQGRPITRRTSQRRPAWLA